MSTRGIYKRKDGRWEARLRFDIDDSSKHMIKSFYGKTADEAEQKLNEFKRTLYAERVTKISVRELCYEWLKVMHYRIKPSTYANYKMKIEKHIICSFSGKLCHQVTRREIYEFISQKLNEGLSARYVSDLIVLLKSLFKYAHKEYSIDYTFGGIVMPKCLPAQVRLLNTDEQRKLRNYIERENDISGLGILLALSLGLRLGEVCALQWKDIDLQKRILYVRKTVQRVTVGGEKHRTRLLVMPPKSSSSAREIPLPEYICNKIAKFIGEPERFVLSEKTIPLEPRTLQYRFETMLEKADLPAVTFHSLRHTFATNAIALGFDVKTLAEILGHSKVEITLNRYVHTSMDRKRACMELVSSFG